MTLLAQDCSHGWGKTKTIWRNNIQERMWGEFLLIQKAQQTSSSGNTKWSIPRHIIVKLLQAGEKENLKSSKRKRAYYIQGSIHMIHSQLLTQDKSWMVFVSAQGRKLSTWNSVSSRTSEMKAKKTFSDIDQKNPPLADLPVLQAERKWHVGNLGSQEEKSTGNGKYVG